MSATTTRTERISDWRSRLRLAVKLQGLRQTLRRLLRYRGLADCIIATTSRPEITRWPVRISLKELALRLRCSLPKSVRGVLPCARWMDSARSRSFHCAALSCVRRFPGTVQHRQFVARIAFWRGTTSSAPSLLDPYYPLRLWIAVLIRGSLRPVPQLIFPQLGVQGAFSFVELPRRPINLTF